MHKYIVRVRFNPFHAPAGSPQGGQFTYANHDVASVAELDSYMLLLAKHGGYHPNIINMTVAGKHIFHPDKSLGLARDQMPQIPTAFREDFLQSIPHQKVDLDPTRLHPTQAQIDGFKTAKFYEQDKRGVDQFRPPIVSQDGYIIDGHHNWASKVVAATITPGISMPALRVKMDRDELLAYAHEYAAKHGFESKPIHKFNPFHLPKGPGGGQFTSESYAAGQGEVFDPLDPAMNEFDQHFGPFRKREYEHRWTFDTEEAWQVHSSEWAKQAQFFRDHPQFATDVMNYQGVMYEPLNAYLRTGNPHADKHFSPTMPVGDAKSMAARMERTLDEAPRIPDGTVLYRAFRSDRVMDRAKHGDLVGGQFQDRAFLSTTTNPVIMGNFYEDKSTKNNAVLMRIKTADGVRGAYAPAASNSAVKRPGEYEFILNRSTPIYVDKVTHLKAGGIIIDGTVYGDGLKTKFNPHHKPAGPGGGQFTSAPGGEATRDLSPFDFNSLESVFDKTPFDEAQKVHAQLSEQAMKYRDDDFNGDNYYEGGVALDEYQRNYYRPMNAFLANTNANLDVTPAVIDAVRDAGDRDFTSYDPYEIKAYVQKLDKFLDKAPSLPDDITLYRTFRSDELTKSHLIDALVGKTYTDPRFLSTTAYGAMAHHWVEDRIGDGNIVVMKLKTKNAKGLYLTGGHYNPDAYEYEVLFDRNTPIHVTNIRPLVANTIDSPNDPDNRLGVVIEGTIGGR